MNTLLPTIANRGSTHDGARESIAAVYAKAFLGAILSKPEAESTLRELGTFVVDVLDKDPQITSVFGSLRIAPDDIAAMLDRAVRGRLSDDVLRLMHVMNRHGRLSCLRDVYAAARKQWNEKQGIVEVRVTTATPLDSHQAEEIRASLANRLNTGVELQAHVDPSILGGIQIRVGDTVYDASVTQRLKTLRDETLAAAVSKIRANRGLFETESTATTP